MNKYRPGGRCGGDTAKEKSNPEFNASLASLLQQRERQDAMFTGPVVSATAETPQKNQLAIVESKPKETKPKATALDKQAYIELLLEGDYEE
jgi:hypothetical protein